MSEYWQDKRVNRGQVACAWALVLVVLALMVAITTLMEPDCPDGRNMVASACEEGKIMRQATAQRLTR
jgi:hypothetical protein